MREQRADDPRSDKEVLVVVACYTVWLKVSGACQSDITVELQSVQPANRSCAEGYDLAICSVCADRYKKAKDNSCLGELFYDRLCFVTAAELANACGLQHATKRTRKCVPRFGGRIL